MGSSSQKSTTSSSTMPWQNALPEVGSLINGVQNLIPGTGVNPTESGAISQLTANGQAGNPWQTLINGVTGNMLNGGGATSQVPAIQTNLDAYKNEMAPYVDPSYSTVNSPQTRAALDQIQNDVTNNVEGQFSAAGRTGSGYEGETIGRGVAAGEAPILLNQANQDTATRMGAANSLYGAGNTTAGEIAGLNQTGVNNENAGISDANSALNASNWGPEQILQAQQLLHSLPTSNLASLANIGIPLAQLGQTGTNNTDTTNNPSLLSELTSIGGLFGSKDTSPIQGMANVAGGIGSGVASFLPFLGL